MTSRLNSLIGGMLSRTTLSDTPPFAQESRRFSVCFAENDPGLPGGGRLRTTPLGTRLYLSSEQELRALFEPLFDIEELSTISLEGRRTAHLAVRTLLRKSGQLRC